MMNFRWMIGTLGLALSLVGSAAHAENPDHMRQLLTTGDCPGCDLSEVSLNGLALQDANLQGANLSGSQLQEVDLTRADLTTANLSGVRLNGVNLTGANLQTANMSEATSVFVCDSSVFGYTDDVESCVAQILPLQVFQELCAEDSELAESLGASIGEPDASCSEETLIDIALYSVYSSSQLFMRPLQLRGANLSGANLKNADFSGAEFSYATLDNVEATGANFSYTRLFNTDVTGLLNADLTDAWEDWESLGEWMLAAQAKSEERAEREAGKIYIGSMGRAQQAHYLERDRFATDLAALELGLSEDDEQFRFGIIAPTSSDRIVQYALPQNSGFPGFLGVVSVEIEPESGYEVTTSNICESETVEAIAVSDLPTIESPGDSFTCPEGWKLVVD